MTGYSLGNVWRQIMARLLRNCLFEMVPLEGLEPPLLSEADFESAASTIPPQGHWVVAIMRETLSRQPERGLRLPDDPDYRFHRH